MVNVGSADRALRFIAGFILILLGFLPAVSQSLGGWSWALVAAGAIFVVTATLRFCPAYLLMGIKTCKQ
ncbi:MAG: DUF2892 domain-containing protein [Aestuariivirgaceae bacterium]|nr:DUF2892 domain-containing protein [Aestuariivirgaceae bacterium]